ncbi:MAG TPA: TonB-dependent receptor [Chitinophagales bacterium]
MKFLYSFIGVFIVHFCFSQGIKDTIIHLKEAEISSSIEKELVRFVRVESDNKSVTEFLKKSQSFFIRNYGQSGLASISYRGTSAAQNEVFWNGIKINSPFTGQVDGNLLLLDFNQNITLSSSSNAIGARIGIDDEEQQGATALIRYTSLNSISVGGSVSQCWKRFFATGTASAVYSKNDFRFRDQFDINNAWKKQTHNALLMGNIKTAFGYVFNENHKISASFWWSENNREIPTLSSTSTPSQQVQYDRSVRVLLNYKGNINDFSIVVRTAYLNDTLNYQDKQISLISVAQSSVWRNEMILHYNFSKQGVQAGIAAKHDYEYGVFDSFSRDRHIVELRQHIVFNRHFFSAEATAFQTIFRHQVIPSFVILAQYHFRKKNIEQQLSLSVARTLRIPSMNDLYYPLSGNPNLKPETGWKGDVSWKMNHTYFQTKLTTYGQYTTNWILWSPINPVIWTPQNLKRVYGCGTEVFVSSGWFENKMRRDWFAYFVSSYSWNRMINIDAISANDASANKQLIYVPVHKLYTALRGGWRGFSASIDYTFYSKIYTSTDNSQSLHGYGLMDVHLSYEFDVKGQKITPSFGIYNLLNTQYQTMPQRAMPGRYYEVLIRFNLKG